MWGQDLNPRPGHEPDELHPVAPPTGQFSCRVRQDPPPQPPEPRATGESSRARDGPQQFCHNPRHLLPRAPHHAAERRARPRGDPQVTLQVRCCTVAALRPRVHPGASAYVAPLCRRTASVGGWACLDSNQGPLPYQRRQLTPASYHYVRRTRSLKPFLHSLWNLWSAEYSCVLPRLVSALVSNGYSRAAPSEAMASKARRWFAPRVPSRGSVRLSARRPRVPGMQDTSGGVGAWQGGPHRDASPRPGP